MLNQCMLTSASRGDIIDVHVDKDMLGTASHIHAGSAGLCQTVLTELQKEISLRR